MADLEDIKSRFIVDDDKYEEEKIAAVIEIANRFMKVSKSGRVLFERVDFSNKDSIALIFLGRFLGSILNPEISREVSNEEINKLTDISIKQISARISDLKREKLIERSGPASHKVTGMFAAERYLEKIRRRFDV